MEGSAGTARVCAGEWRDGDLKDMSIMAHESVVPANALRPQGPYSSAVKAGALVFVSGQPGIDPITGLLPQGGFEAECRQAFSNLASALRTAQAELCDVVKTTVLYVDPQDLPTINAIYAEIFPENPPARTSAIVTLVNGRRISVDAIASTEF